MNDINLLALPVGELKRLLVTSKHFEEVMTFFFDHFAELPGFLEASHPITVPDDLREGLGPLMSKLYPKKNVATKWLIQEVDLLGIIHGTVTFADKMAVVVWARELSMGIVAMPGKSLAEVLYARISVTAKHTGAAN